MNRVIQPTQMDILVRFWDVKSSRVKTRYLGSAFLGFSKAGDLVQAFKDQTKDLPMNKLLQISMDGPKVNWKFVTDLNNHRTAEGLNETLEMGSCGLHIIHGAFKTGHLAAEFEVHQLLRCAYNLLKDSPARRAKYLESATNREMPLKFCSVRWVENISVGSRMVLIFPDLQRFVRDLKAVPQTVAVYYLMWG